MKTMILIPAVLVLFLTGHGQTSTGTNDSGVVKYDDKMKLNIKLEGESAGYADMLPKERTEQKILYFTPDVSVYQGDKEKKNPDDVEQEAGGAMVHVQMASSDDKIYRDLKAHKKIEQREFMTRMFLIESDAGKADWKLTGAQKTILGFPCQEALREDDGKKFRAWFTPSIPVSSGPQNFGNLPGLILSVDIDDGQRTITASSVTFTTVDKSLLVKPKEGKKVTAEQFHKIVDEKRKEMGADDGNGAHAIIRIQK
jgi:GLPGLI family protein